jgi:hypothetical protein
LQVVSLPTSSYVHVEKYGMEMINWTFEESRQEPLNGLSPTRLRLLEFEDEFSSNPGRLMQEKIEKTIILIMYVYFSFPSSTRIGFFLFLLEFVFLFQLGLLFLFLVNLGGA